jgi:hypothetical protein
MLDGFERSQRGMEPRRSDNPFESVQNPIGLFAPSVPYDPSGDALRQHFARNMDLTLAYYVDPKMTALVTAAAESLPADTVLRPHDLPSTHGFLLLPQGLAEVDLRGQMMIHNAVAWFQRAGGVDLWFLSNKHEDRDMVNLRMRAMHGEEQMRSYPEIAPAEYIRIEFGAGVPLSVGGTKVLPPELTAQMRVTLNSETGQYAWFWPEGYDMDEWVGSTMELRPNGPTTWMFALWRLMQQTILDVRTEDVERSLRRAARKRNMKRDTVTVIRLRKRKRTEPEGPEQEIEWSHRWLVRGHWRSQWYGPRNGGPDERYQVPIWIHPQIRGPEDKPLLVRDHVYSLER